MAKAPHGGARPGSGRKKKAEKFAPQIDATEKRIADKLPEIADKLLSLALDGAELVSEVYEPAATVTVDVAERVTDSQGNDRIVKGLKMAFPDLPGDEMVLVKRTVTQHYPDRQAGVYLINRILGTPVQQIEAEVANRQEIPDALQAAMIEAYGPDDDDNEDAAGGDDGDEDWLGDDGDEGEDERADPGAE